MPQHAVCFYLRISLFLGFVNKICSIYVTCEVLAFLYFRVSILIEAWICFHVIFRDSFKHSCACFSSVFHSSAFPPYLICVHVTDDNWWREIWRCFEFVFQDLSSKTCHPFPIRSYCHLIFRSISLLLAVFVCVSLCLWESNVRWAFLATLSLLSPLLTQVMNANDCRKYKICTWSRNLLAF